MSLLRSILAFSIFGIVFAGPGTAAAARVTIQTCTPLLIPGAVTCIAVPVLIPGATVVPAARPAPPPPRKIAKRPVPRHVPARTAPVHTHKVKGTTKRCHERH